MSPERLQELNEASIASQFDQTLRGNGNGNLLWSAVALFLGMVQLWSEDLFGFVNLFFGLALVVTGLYMRQARNPKVVKVSAAVIAGMALWNLGGFALTVAGKMKMIGSLHAAVAGILQAIAAYRTWQSYDAYAAVHAAMQQGTAGEVRAALATLHKARPREVLDVIEMRFTKATEPTVVIRMREFEDGVLVGFFKETFGRLKEPSALFVNKGDIWFEGVAEKMLSRKRQMTLYIAGEEYKKTEITPEMLERLEAFLGGARALAASFH